MPLLTALLVSLPLIMTFFRGLVMVLKKYTQVCEALCSFVNLTSEEATCNLGFHFPSYLRHHFNVQPTQVSLSPMNIIREPCPEVPEQNSLSFKQIRERKRLSMLSVFLFKFTIFSDDRRVLTLLCLV